MGVSQLTESIQESACGAPAMRTTVITLSPAARFHFEHTAYCHGWAVLAPNMWEADRRALKRVERLGSGAVVRLDLAGAGSVDHPEVTIAVRHAGRLRPAEKGEIASKVRWMLRLDEDLSEF